MKVLSFSFWDIPAEVKPMNALFPIEANHFQNTFSKFYWLKFGERLLIWLYNLGEVKLSVNWRGRQKEVTMSKLQCCICMQFNSLSKLSYRELKAKLAVNEKEVFHQLLGLVSSDLLAVEGRAKKEVLGMATLADADLIVLSQDLDKMRPSVRVKQLKRKASVEEPADKQYSEYKRVKLESIIMKLMKSEKKASFESLWERSARMLGESSPLTKKEVIEVIDKLIIKDYLERDAKDTNLFLYKQ